MKNFGSADEVLDFAITREEEAAQFYTELAKKMNRAWMQQVFEDFAKEEQGHKQKLLSVKQGKRLLSAEKKVMDLKIGDYLVDVGPGEELDYQQALIVAMKKEKAAFRLYTDLSATTDDSNLQNLLLSLAQEEAKHKLRFELEYDEHFLAQN
ncbi:rubrerythrin [candidate division KSB3 bacterium]|uniref:Rubrerythrin n=1 Tax=candidate division KSB3 bacterium TaxID=2044937 RepID=A0A9D5JTS1_9BACT|nr:rubrerythrin [candidate division KSB3 bacterium]MBD3323531.1 rubrerythrin [candidate division KSB3 bacterium]